MGMFSPGSDRRAYDGEWARKRAVGGLHAPAQDPTSSASLSNRGLGDHAGLRYGRVVDGVAYAHAYKVLFEGGMPPIPCVLGAQTALLPVGARAINTLVAGSQVWAIVHPQLAYGVIVAVEPPWNTDPSLTLSDVIHGASRCGLRVDRAHASVLDLDGSGGVIDWSAHRPLDSTMGGEWGAMTETGLGVTLDSAMVQLSVDEGTGVFGFYHDQLLRVSGHNLQVRSLGLEEEHLDDGGRVLIYRGTSAYAAEALGSLTAGTDPLRTLTAQQSQVDTPEYGPAEPVKDDQLAFHRVVELGGFLGQGGKRLLLAPPQGEDLFRASGTGPVPALFEEQLALTGRYTIRTAKALHLRKQLAIPGLRRTGRPEDRKGDRPEDTKVVGQLEDGDPDHPQLQQAAGLGDVLAYANNLEGEAALLGRDDWRVDEESATPPGMTQAPLGFGTLAKSTYLDRPDSIPTTVDTRYGPVSYYPNESGISLLDDGGVVIHDGYGAALVLSGGHATLSAPGDVWLKPGRNANIWAGHDAIVRAKNSIDLSATGHDVRLKAEGNVQVLAGNGGSGAVLLESRAPASFGYLDKVGEDVEAGGIHLKAKGGPVVVYGQDIYLNAGDPDADQGGRITLDAGRGTGTVVAYTQDFDRYLGGSASDYFGTGGAVTSANTDDGTTTVLGGGLIVAQAAEILDGGLSVQGDIVVAAGHISTQLASENSGLVGTPSDASMSQLTREIAQGGQDAKDLVTAGKANWKAVFTDGYYARGQAGDPPTMAAVGFSFRDEAQYLTEDGWALYEDRWQQLARLGGGSPAAWTESPVKAGSATTYPYPGKKPWVDGKSLLRQDLALVDPATGLAKDRDDSGYDDPAFKAADPVACDGNYAIIV